MASAGGATTGSSTEALRRGVNLEPGPRRRRGGSGSRSGPRAACFSVSSACACGRLWFGVSVAGTAGAGRASGVAGGVFGGSAVGVGVGGASCGTTGVGFGGAGFGGV